MSKVSSPPVEWDSKTVVGVRERIKISGFGIKKPLNFQDQITNHKWKYAAGYTGEKTKKQTAAVHIYARKRVWAVVMADRARLVDENDRTDEQNAAIQKVDHPRAYKKSRKGNSGGKPIKSPPATWRTELIGDTRTEAWKYAGWGVRFIINRNARVEEIQAKDECNWSTEDHDLMEAEDNRRSKKIELRVARENRRQQQQQDICNAFIEKHPELLVANDKPLTEENAFDIAFNLFDDSDSEYGKPLFDALGLKTLRHALYEANSSIAIYIGAGRGFGAESYRFLVGNAHAATTVLTREDGTNFKSSEQEYKDLELVSVPVGHFTSWSDCTAVEAAMQLILDDLEVGSQRLWLRSGVGRDRRQLRVRDAKYIEKRQAAGEDGNLTFVCFITILRNVEVLSRCTDTVTGKDVVECIKAGSGTICRVHQPRSPEPVCNPAQKTALDAARIKLGFNCIDINRKRKLDDFLSTESEDAMGEDERSENEE
jgi:hypothetical protein